MNILISLIIGAAGGFLLSLVAPELKLGWIPRVVWIAIGIISAVGVTVGVIK